MNKHLFILPLLLLPSLAQAKDQPKELPICATTQQSSSSLGLPLCNETCLYESTTTISHECASALKVHDRAEQTQY